ncbi:MAG: hypothetical protein H6581_29385 [Bacteroidia bacterium]|nr:hypothetical protein [Bacteroidia bacterium]
MIKKEIVQNALNEFPEEFSIDELLDRLILLQKIQTGLEQSKNNHVISNEDAKVRMAKWLK